MKQIKRLFAVVIAFLLVVPFFATRVFAASDTIVKVTGLETGDVVKYYQVLKWTPQGWEVTDDFAGILNDTTRFPHDPDKTDRNQEVVDLICDGLTETEVRAIAAQTNKTPAPTPKSTDDVTEADNGVSTYEIPADSNNANLGLYLALITAGKPGFVYNPVIVSADFDDENDTETINASTAQYTPTALAKKKDTEVKKTTEDSNSAIATAIDSYIGQLVTFYVETTVPVYLDSYTEVNFAIEDEIKTTGIEYQKGTVVVKLDNVVKYDEDNTEPDEFTLVENDKGYTITFDDDFLKANTTPITVNIEYKGKITNAATFNVNEDDNTVTVTYTNGPNGEQAAMRDQTNHYTFSIGAQAFGSESEDEKTWELIKVGADKDGKPIYEATNVSSWGNITKRHPLAGATFGLFTDEACETPYTGKDGDYSGSNTFVTGSDGIITFKGLDAGVYYIKEISAPAGYTKDVRVVKVQIIPKYEEVSVPDTVEEDSEGNEIKVKGYTVNVLKSYQVLVNNVSVYDEEVEPDGQYTPADGIVETKYEFDHEGPHISKIIMPNDPDAEETSDLNDSELVNPPGTELPSTGGIGTTLFYVFGGIMVVGAGILLVSRQRMMN